ncbi:rhomboid-like protein 11, chloroplastic isoform X1 [Physcomitrium patens]|nr:rhomboid-like protein 11, chloroplastic isoform X1 [Physcomitrium patens]|eukprot:XP_024396022.1 rhomboid-like protein 11, chloroplastic isoform X1 [Physcomitrella patens]
MVVAGGPQSGRKRDQGFLRGFGVCEILLERGLAMASGMLRCTHLALSSRVQGLAHFNRGARGNSDGSLASERATQFSKLSLPRSPSPVVPFPECQGQTSPLNTGRFGSVELSRRGTRSMAKDPGTELQALRGNGSGSISQLELESSGNPKKKASFNGIFTLLLINFVAFAADHWLKLPFVRSLYLYHDFPRWYQFFTSTFIHASWAHLSSNLFFLYIFGKLVEEEEGSFAVWLSYIFTGVGANLVSWLILPRTVVSVGASGAVFGLFAISVLVKLSFDWRKILEVLILGQFVVDKVMEAAQASTQLAGRTFMGASNINHIAHLSGALVGVLLIWLLNGISHLADKPSSK